jgi:hypothetical protein
VLKLPPEPIFINHRNWGPKNSHSKKQVLGDIFGLKEANI